MQVAAAPRNTTNPLAEAVTRLRHTQLFRASIGFLRIMSAAMIVVIKPFLVVILVAGSKTLLAYGGLVRYQICLRVAVAPSDEFYHQHLEVVSWNYLSRQYFHFFYHDVN